MRERGLLTLSDYFGSWVILGMGTNTFITDPKTEITSIRKSFLFPGQVVQPSSSAHGSDYKDHSLNATK